MSEIEDSYDRVAEDYAREFAEELNRKPFDRAMLDRFAGSVNGSVCEIGCGPGHIARYLKDRGVDMRGIDLSAEMIKQARRLHPTIPFDRGDMLDLDLPDSSLAGIVCFYAIIHLRRDDVSRALTQMGRVLRPGGRLFLSFHGGEGMIRRDEWYGKRVSIDVTMFERDEMDRYLRSAGFTVEEILERPPYSFEYQTKRVYAFATR